MDVHLIDLIAKFFLFFTDPLIIPIIILGFIWIDREIFYDAICLLLISMILNCALKNTFKIPLPEALGKEGFAFPSGHMQSTAILYGWLFFKFKKIIYRLCLATLIIGAGPSLVHFGYHYYYDIFGALICALILGISYHFIKIKKQTFLPILSFSFATILMIYISINYKVPDYVLMAYYALIGLIFSEKIFAAKNAHSDVLNKIITTAICFISIFSIKYIFSVVFTGIPLFLYQLQWCIIGFIIPASHLITNKFVKKET